MHGDFHVLCEGNLLDVVKDEYIPVGIIHVGSYLLYVLDMGKLSRIVLLLYHSVPFCLQK